MGASNAKRQRRSKPKKFACMVFGTVGDGKSMLCAVLAAPKEFQPDGDLPNARFATAGGVTKLVKSYFMTPQIAEFLGVDEAIIYDTPGVGDADAKMSEVLGKVHAMVQGGLELNCIIMTNKSKIVVALTKCDEQQK